MNLPVREYLGSVLPGLANRSIQRVGELTPRRPGRFPTLTPAFGASQPHLKPYPATLYLAVLSQHYVISSVRPSMI